jgi:hypothetical protein
MTKYKSSKKTSLSGHRSPALRSVLGRVRSLAELGDRISTSKQAVARWDDVPLDRIPEVCDAVGLPPSKIRPDYVLQLFELEKRWKQERSAA